jgi:hypothetical protein
MATGGAATPPPPRDPNPSSLTPLTITLEDSNNEEEIDWSGRRGMNVFVDNLVPADAVTKDREEQEQTRDRWTN